MASSSSIREACALVIDITYKSSKTDVILMLRLWMPYLFPSIVSELNRCWMSPHAWARPMRVASVKNLKSMSDCKRRGMDREYEAVMYKSVC
jgi:hypothetical protein